MKDLVVLVADRNIEAGIRGLLSRPNALGIRRVEFEIFTHPRRDPGCYQGAHDFLRPLYGQYHRALVIFDRAWEGAPYQAPEALEAAVRERLRIAVAADWADDVVIDPELEAWVWSDSPHVDQYLAWQGRIPSLRNWLRAQGLWPEGATKPGDPKRALESALWEVRVPRSSSIYEKLARSVSVERCSDQAFYRLRERLRAWFLENQP